MLLNIYIASVILTTISIFFYIKRLRNLLEEFNQMSSYELFINFIISVLLYALIPGVNIFAGLTFFLNAFFLGKEDFIRNHTKVD